MKKNNTLLKHNAVWKINKLGRVVSSDVVIIPQLRRRARRLVMDLKELEKRAIVSYSSTVFKEYFLVTVEQGINEEVFLFFDNATLEELVKLESTMAGKKYLWGKIVVRRSA